MGLQISNVVQACGAISRQIKESRKNLTIHFIVHHEGHRLEALALAGQEIMGHPAAETALHILRSPRQTEESALIGVAIGHERLFFGMSARESLLALCTLNIDQYETLEDARRHAYHIAWHALDAQNYHQRARNNGSSNQVVVRRRNLMEIASANMQADAFAGVMCALQGYTDVIQDLGLVRGKNILQMISAHNPEYYPFVISMESVVLAVDQMKERVTPQRKYVENAMRIAREISLTFGKEALKQWFLFGEPAQDMAWRGYNNAEILSAAINTSEDTYVRATGYLISDITGIKPAPAMKIRENYSAFADDDFNSKLHENSIHDTFEYVIAQGLKEKNAAPFLAMANNQNLRLTEGHAVGWCASALQASATAFEDALRAGDRHPENAARRRFEDKENRTGWGSLKVIGKKIIGQYRQGNVVTLEDIDDLCKGEKDTGSIRKSVAQTISDPSYQKSLENSRDLGLRASPAPRTPAPAVARAMAPATPAAAALPGMGLGGRPATRQAVRQTGQAAQGDQTGEQREQGS